MKENENVALKNIKILLKQIERNMERSSTVEFFHLLSLLYGYCEVKIEIFYHPCFNCHNAKYFTNHDHVC